MRVMHPQQATPIAFELREAGSGAFEGVDIGLDGGDEVLDGNPAVAQVLRVKECGKGADAIREIVEAIRDETLQGGGALLEEAEHLGGVDRERRDARHGSDDPGDLADRVQDVQDGQHL